MDFDDLLQTLMTQADLFRDLVVGVSPAQARWKPAPDRWSILEVINHLYDEERADFRVRLGIILHRLGEPWPEIRPMEWVTERRYNERELAASLEAFLDERRASLEWLNGLNAPDWGAHVETPWGMMQAGDMFAAWVFHGELHMQQLVRLRQDYIAEQARPYRVAYAGEL